MYDRLTDDSQKDVREGCTQDQIQAVPIQGIKMRVVWKGSVSYRPTDEHKVRGVLIGY